MKLYIIFTVETSDNNSTTITWKKDMHLFKEAAFEIAKKIGPSACVMEMEEADSWNFDQIKDEEY